MSRLDCRGLASFGNRIERSPEPLVAPALLHKCIVRVQGSLLQICKPVCSRRWRVMLTPGTSSLRGKYKKKKKHKRKNDPACRKNDEERQVPKRAGYVPVVYSC